MSSLVIFINDNFVIKIKFVAKYHLAYLILNVT
jgi:hypothetical protein